MTNNLTASKARQAISYGYALPIIGTTIAIVLGLFVRDFTHTELTTWIWVLIQAIVGTGLVFGTWYSNLADGYRSKSGNKIGATEGARGMNFVLSIIWSVAVTIMAFSLGAAAVDKLRDYNVGNGQPTAKPLTVQIFFDDWFPALVILLITGAGIYALLWARTREVKKAKLEK